MEHQDGRYRTSDLYYAAYLKVAGIPFLGTERDLENGRRVFFIFSDTEGLKDLKTQYFNRIAKVPALTFADEIKNMKALTYMAGA